MPDTYVEERITLPSDHAMNVLGQFDENAKKIEKTLKVSVISREGDLRIIGVPSAVKKAKSAIEELIQLSKR